MEEPHPCVFLTTPGHGYSFALSKVGISRDLFPPAYFVKCCPSNVLLTPIWPVYRPHLRCLTSLGLCQRIRVIACPENRNEKCLIVKFYFFLARIKRTDLGKAKTVVGTCPDMCPEKERYMRETRNQLSIFEVLLGSDKV